MPLLREAGLRPDSGRRNEISPCKVRERESVTLLLTPSLASPHLAERPNRIRHVLEDLMSVDNVERIIWELQRADIASLEGDVGDFLSGCERSCLFERIGGVFYACDVALGNEPG